jgi:signal transduction histidine kinase/CheY-like chemotaxis protein
VEKAIPAEQRQWRERVLAGLGWTAAGVALVVAATNLVTGDGRGAAIGTSLAAVFLLVALLRRRLALGARTLLLAASVCAVAGVAIALEGFAPNTPLALGAGVVFVTLLLGTRSGLAMVAVGSTTMVAAAAVHLGGAAALGGHEDTFGTLSPQLVARVVFNFAVISSSLVVAISYLLGRAEALLLDKAAALERLTEEQREAERMRAELSRHEDALRKAREIEILGRLAGTVAHDFNNALLVIQANVDLIRHQPGHLETGLGQIAESVLFAASTTRQLRGFSRQGATPARPVALGETVVRTAELLERVLPSNIEVDVRVDGELTVLADEGKLQAILVNLALNARDAMPRGGKFAMSVREATRAEAAAGRCALIEVTDEGVGMSEETQSHAFEPYFTTKGDSGTGLGLASVKSMVEAGGGTIALTSAPDEGTQFRILWPLHEEPCTGKSPEPPVRATPQNATVLLVEDDERVRSAMARILGGRGFTVLEAPTGADALTAARRHRGTIDVLCSDCVMPGMPLQQMIEGFRRLFPDARVMLCSGYTPEIVAPPLQMVDAFLAKPFTADILASVMGDLVTRG